MDKGEDLMEYTVVVGSTIEKIIERVNELIVEGWQPLGGIGINGNYYQAMTRVKP